MNYFVEGIQGSGKSTLVSNLVKNNTKLKAYREGDYSPVELAWCAYVNSEKYDEILKKYPQLEEEIKENSYDEDGAKIICYTKIITDVPNFHKDLEQYEIYNGNISRDAFEEIVLNRFSKWNGDSEVFECSVFQNIVENQILFYSMTDEEIMDFYRKVHRALGGKEYKIIYLNAEDIETTLQIIKKERSDESGNELWFPLMIGYLENSPRGKSEGLMGMAGLVKHLEHRQELEKRILEEVFFENSVVVKSKNYAIGEVL